MFNPVATYRIQFHKDFTFENFKQIIPYLHQLGVSTIYASPIFEATPGSNHGYDVVNPHRVNPEIGTLEELREISAELKKLGINWLQDIVPNHMAFHPNNAWLMDVMEKGRESRYADFFDIIWEVPAFNGRLMVPFLGSPVEEIIKDKQLSVSYTNNRLELNYAEQNYPLNLPSYLTVFQSGIAEPPQAIKELSAKAQNNEYSIDELKKQLENRYSEPEVKSYIESLLNNINANDGVLQKIADEQYYELCYWRESEHEINYRRFFTVNSLICLNIQRQEVFDHYHQFIKTLLTDGIIQGVRVDHIDGLYDPATYLQRLRELTGEEAYIVVEKILEEGEKFPAGWPVQGNTGYDFLAIVNNLFTANESKRAFTRFYNKLVPDTKPVTEAILEKKANILYKHMAGELENLYRLFLSLDLAGDTSLEKTAKDQLKSAIGELLIRCPVYRYYGNSFPLNKEEHGAVEAILKSAVKNKPELKGAVGILAEALLKEDGDSAYNAKALRFYQRCMQFTGPLMAKGVEDTLMYTYDRFIGHNEVGDSPEMFGLETGQFHQDMVERQQSLPLSINGTSTHDTKRGEDVRARLNALTDRSEEWISTVVEWQRMNAGLKQNNAPDANDEYLIYQTLAGAYPLPGQDEDNFNERLQAYLTKALREAKVHTGWAEPDEAYEKGTLEFAAKLQDKNTAFWKSFTDWQSNIADDAVINSLGQVLLKFTCPGVPDIYQGCELWDLSLVDPDNRRPVDYEIRDQYITDAPDIKQLWALRYNGGIKLWLTNVLLHLRKENAELFSRGTYTPLRVKGKYKDHIIAFTREHLNNAVIVIAPLHTAALNTTNLLEHDWDDTSVIIPDDAPLQWEAILGDKPLFINGEITIQEVFKNIPLGILRSAKPVSERSAGIIMHITSLPSLFGVGDLGPEARKFADFLSNANQKYWQLLPLNPTGAAAFNSPYSSFSSMAGNTLLISPEDLTGEALLTAEELQAQVLPHTDKVNFEVAARTKKALLDLAFERFKNAGKSELQSGYLQFKEQESYWLDDFALYEVLKSHHQDKPWYEWADAFKQRDDKALEDFSQEQADQIDERKWLQFIFFRQWTALRNYGNNLGIKFFGDLPFYVSYDSADVWTHPEIFKLDENKAMAGIAGVPPDYFNAGGQLWGMPVYNWDKLAETNYAWWVDRIRKNMEFFDVVRLDHFRAFYDYWEVPAGEETAVNGEWKLGPAAKLFKTLEEQLGEVPFIAEDLGDVSPGVYELRDELNLPGMNLLQYGFGGDMPVSIHIPHNHIVNSVTYTGTHDNNTTKGWFKQDSTEQERDNLSQYTKVKVNKQNVQEILIEVCYASVSKIAIVPLQDILGLDEKARMNMPSSKEGNWLWQLKPGLLTQKVEQRLKKLVKLYNR